MSDTAIDQVLAETSIDGLDISDALSRMGNSGKLYMRIIHSFVTNMPDNLKDMATEDINADTLSDYAIRIHGAKGSCYGIGANKVGDLAKALEMAAKAGELETCQNKNDEFLTGTRELIKELEALEARIEEAQSGNDVMLVDKPDPAKLAALLAATQSFDIEQMNKLVEELTSVNYANDGAVINAIKAGFEAFDYQTIEETILAYL